MQQESHNLGLTEPAELLGDLHPLVEQLGSADGLVTLSAAAASLRPGGIHSLPALREFISAYQAQLLAPVELPAILRARQHADRNELRELIALDHQLAEDSRLREFAAASRRVGRSQLARLRPLRDQRFVQRYLHAVENSEASGWHTLVYGITLSLYSIPLRQGLLNYAQQTIAGFTNAATRPLKLSEAARFQCLDEFYADLPAMMEATLAGSTFLLEKAPLSV